MRLAELQARFTDAVGGADAAGLPLAVPGGTPDRRLEIYRRHRRQSLTGHLVRRFPTATWLLGEARMKDVAGAYATAHPPQAPCMAEYGAGFAAFLATSPQVEGLLYLISIAQADWYLGEVAVAVDGPPLEIAALSSVPPARLPDLWLTLQPGLRYLAADWPIDELVRLRLEERAPERFELTPRPVHLEIAGTRGSFRLRRLAAGHFAFRAALSRGAPIAAAADAALAHDADFDPGTALAALFADGLVTSIHLEDQQ